MVMSAAALLSSCHNVALCTGACVLCFQERRRLTECSECRSVQACCTSCILNDSCKGHAVGSEINVDVILIEAKCVPVQSYCSYVYLARSPQHRPVTTVSCVLVSADRTCPH